MQPEDGYSIQEYSKIAKKHVNTIRKWVKSGRLPVRVTQGPRGYEYRIFPDGLPQEDVKVCDGDTDINTDTSIIKRDEMVELIEYRGQIKVLRDEVSFLRQQVFNHNHWQPWRELIRITGQGLLNIVTMMTTPKSERKR